MKKIHLGNNKIPVNNMYMYAYIFTSSTYHFTFISVRPAGLILKASLTIIHLSQIKILNRFTPTDLNGIFWITERTVPF